jgi:hypothetical protein
MRKIIFLCLLGLLSFHTISSKAASPEADIDEYRGWIEEMKELERGPFLRLRWFCNDGTVFPPQSYACRDHGGGYQHGEWNSNTVKLREQGFLVAMYWRDWMPAA